MQILRVPGHYRHGFKVIGYEAAYLLYFVNKLYNYDNPDEERRPWNDRTIVPVAINGKRLVKSAVKDTQSGFRAFTLKTLEELQDAESKGFGIESEQLALATKKGLKIVEVPMTIKYKGLSKTSKRLPLLHGGEIITTILRLIVEESPLLYLVVPGLALMIVATALGAYLFLLFNATRYFGIPIAILSVGAGLTGIILIIAALMLYGVNRIAKRIENNQKRE